MAHHQVKAQSSEEKILLGLTLEILWFSINLRAFVKEGNWCNVVSLHWIVNLLCRKISGSDVFLVFFGFFYCRKTRIDFWHTFFFWEGKMKLPDAKPISVGIVHYHLRRKRTEHFWKKEINCTFNKLFLQWALWLVWGCSWLWERF